MKYLVLLLVAVTVSASAAKIQFTEEQQDRINRLYLNSDAFCHVVNRPKGAVFTCFTKNGRHYVFFAPGQA